MYTSTLISNHQTMYVKTYLVGNDWRSQVSLLSSDAFQLELELLEKHHGVFHQQNKVF